MCCATVLLQNSFSAVWHLNLWSLKLWRITILPKYVGVLKIMMESTTISFIYCPVLNLTWHLLHSDAHVLSLFETVETGSKLVASIETYRNDRILEFVL